MASRSRIENLNSQMNVEPACICFMPVVGRLLGDKLFGCEQQTKNRFMGALQVTLSHLSQTYLSDNGGCSIHVMTTAVLGFCLHNPCCFVATNVIFPFTFAH